MWNVEKNLSKRVLSLVTFEHTLVKRTMSVWSVGKHSLIRVTSIDTSEHTHSAAVETVSHLVSGCQTLLADGHYTACHSSKICKYIIHRKLVRN